MPNFFVLRCFDDNCATFQVHQEKKARKWNCKICGAKQSLKKVFFQGTGKECRLATQDFNMRKQHIAEENCSQEDEVVEGNATREESLCEKGYGDWENEHFDMNTYQEPSENVHVQVENEWDRFLPKKHTLQSQDESDEEGDIIYTTERPVSGKAKRRKR
eukprot:Nk52_evm12s1129 gene=Nk52_evmTU12s1129